MKPTPQVLNSPRTLYRAIAALIMAFIPFICVAGLFLGIDCLKQSTKIRDVTVKILSIVAIVVGSLSIMQTLLILIFFLNA